LDALLRKDAVIRQDFTAKRIDTTDFAKKLLGQIVFLYFLQKKGWLGVGRNDSGRFGRWGDGPKDFLRRLFNKQLVTYQNFFNDLLEPLFYEALAIDRGEESFYSRFNCRIPFLNGGLFEPIGGYNWQETDILIRNETFSEILDTFDLFNFTVREDEPLEKEVAVDPEMLGKVFENLLEVRDRKSKGTYYTPREIVHYMCRESLINYLDGAVNIGEENLGGVQPSQVTLFDVPGPEQLALKSKTYRPVVPRVDLECFVRHGHLAIEHDRQVGAKGRETETYRFQVPESVRRHAQALDTVLADIKVCDPAIGSGAFPVGMLHEIVRARETLTTYLGEAEERTPYAFKRHAIQESLYGVDIDPGAVEIAKLRLWLSLVVDEEQFESIKPLPNLDYKIVCGDSLGSVERNLLNNHLFVELEECKQRFFEETNIRRKKKEKARIDGLIRELTNDDRHFDYEVYFSEVYHAKNGFDLVIANPPYVRQEAIKGFKPQLKKEFPTFYCGTADLYTYFYKRGLEVLHSEGELCFIAPNKFMRAGYGKNTRDLLTREATPRIVIDFGDLPIFDATTYPSILLVEKKAPPAKARTLVATFTTDEQLLRLEKTLAEVGFSLPVSALKMAGWSLERPAVQALMEKLRSRGTSLGDYVQGRFYRGVLTGLNEAFVIDAATRERLIQEDPNSAELIKPWLRGRDIRKWQARWVGLYVIFTRRGTDIDKYPAIKRHLAQFRKDLGPKKSVKDKRGRKPGSYQWFEIQDNIAYFEEFEKTKVVYQEIATYQFFGYANPGLFCNNKCFLIPGKNDFLLGLLNAKITWWFLGQLASGLSGGARAMQTPYMEQLPIPSATATQKETITERVEKILAAPESPEVPRLEAEIDRLVYDLYGLTTEEIALVEGQRANPTPPTEGAEENPVFLGI